MPVRRKSRRSKSARSKKRCSRNSRNRRNPIQRSSYRKTVTFVEPLHIGFSLDWHACFDILGVYLERGESAEPNLTLTVHNLLELMKYHINSLGTKGLVKVHIFNGSVRQSKKIDSNLEEEKNKFFKKKSFGVNEYNREHNYEIGWAQIVEFLNIQFKFSTNFEKVMFQFQNGLCSDSQEALNDPKQALGSGTYGHGLTQNKTLMHPFNEYTKILPYKLDLIARVHRYHAWKLKQLGGRMLVIFATEFNEIDYPTNIGGYPTDVKVVGQQFNTLHLTNQTIVKYEPQKIDLTRNETHDGYFYLGETCHYVLPWDFKPDFRNEKCKEEFGEEATGVSEDYNLDCGLKGTAIRCQLRK